MLNLPYSGYARKGKPPKIYHTLYPVDEVLEASLKLSEAFDGTIVM